MDQQAEANSYRQVPVSALRTVQEHRSVRLQVPVQVLLTVLEPVSAPVSFLGLLLGQLRQPVPAGSPGQQGRPYIPFR